jgi:cytoskeletal protein RodZ
MLSFEFSAFDLVLSVGVIVLIALFVTTLVKLNPSNEDKKSHKDKGHQEEQEFVPPLNNPGRPTDQQNVPYTAQGAEKPTFERIQQPPQVVVSTATGGYSQESLEQTPKQVEHKEPPKNHKTASSQKQASQTSSEKDCFHFFGYLGGLPKNTPIPGECFGCEKIVDCLITVKGKSSRG